MNEITIPTAFDRRTAQNAPNTNRIAPKITNTNAIGFIIFLFPVASAAQRFVYLLGGLRLATSFAKLSTLKNAPLSHR